MPTNLESLTNNYGVTDGDHAWPNNLLTTDAVAQANGCFARKSAAKVPVPPEMAALRELASSAAKVAGRMEVGMGSRSSHTFEPFACHLGRPLERIDTAAIRSIFGDTLYPDAKITIEPLDEHATWWQRVLIDSGLDEDSGGEPDPAVIEEWRRVLAWFDGQASFMETCFVAIDASPPADSFAGDVGGGCVFPRFLLGLHTNGGIAGLFGIGVHS